VYQYFVRNDWPSMEIKYSNSQLTDVGDTCAEVVFPFLSLVFPFLFLSSENMCNIILEINNFSFAARDFSRSFHTL
jgi:hypothetical protein